MGAWAAGEGAQRNFLGLKRGIFFFFLNFLFFHTLSPRVSPSQAGEAQTPVLGSYLEMSGLGPCVPIPLLHEERFGDVAPRVFRAGACKNQGLSPGSAVTVARVGQLAPCLRAGCRHRV